MLYEDEIFKIYYNECDIRYIEKIINIVKMKMPMIMNFFKIRYNKKIVIKLYNDLNEYRKNLELSFNRQAELESKKQGKNIPPRKYEEWMIANTEDGNINMQSLDLVIKQEKFKNYTEEEFCYNACHEFTHLCQEQIGSTNPGWFWEVIATNLGNPECQHEIDTTFTLTDLEEHFDEIDGYGAVYKLGKYLFETKDENEILEMINNNEMLYKSIQDDINKTNE